MLKGIVEQLFHTKTEGNGVEVLALKYTNGRWSDEPAYMPEIARDFLRKVDAFELERCTEERPVFVMAGGEIVWKTYVATYALIWSDAVCDELKIVASQASPVEVATKALAHADEMVRQVTEIVTLTMPLGRMSLDKRDEAFELIYATASQLGAQNIDARSTGYMQDSDVNVSVGIRDVEQIVWDALGELSPTEKRAIIDSNRKFQNS